MRKASFVVLVSILSNGLAWAQPEWEKTREMAESRVEIIRLLIEKKEYERALQEAEQLFAMKMPADKEHLMVKAAKQLADLLVHHGQHAFAVRLLDLAIKSLAQNTHKAELYKEKGYVCEKMGDRDEALRNFELAVELQKNPGK